MATQKAIIVPEPGKTEIVQIPIPSLGPKDILIKNKAIALNPTDWKHRDYPLAEKTPALLGCDFAGVVEKVGSQVTNVKVGDRVAGFVHGGHDPEFGSFAEYVKTEGTLVWKVPNNVSDEEAASLGGIGPHTAVQILYQRHKLNLPSNPTDTAEPVLVYSGATSVGQYAIQLLKLSGYIPVATASPSNFELLKSLGAAALYDYSDPEAAAQISAAYPTLSKAVDTIAEKSTRQFITASFGKETGQKTIWGVAGPGADEELPEDVFAAMTLVYTVMGKGFNLGKEWPASAEDKKQMEEWLVYVPELIGSGKLKSNPIHSLPGGLEGVEEGLALIKSGKNRAQKITLKL